MASPRILVTGGAGFVGSAIVRAVCAEYPNASVAIVDLETTDSTQSLTSDFDVKVMNADITVPAEISRAVASFQPDVVVHTAGIVPPLAERYGRRMQSTVYQINVEGTRNVVNASVENGVSALVYTSSFCAVTDDMTTPWVNVDERWPTSSHSSIYGESKALAEEIVLSANSNSNSFSTCVIRPSVLCGPGDQQLVPPIHACISKGETPFIIGDGGNLWDVTYVDNIADAHVLAVKNLLTTKTAAGEAFFISNQEPITFRDFSLAVWGQFGHIPPYNIYIPFFLAWFFGLVAEIFTWITGTPTTLSRGSINDAGIVRYANGSKARQILGYEARIGLVEGIRLSCKEYAKRMEQAGPSKSRENGLRPQENGINIREKGVEARENGA